MKRRAFIKLTGAASLAVFSAPVFIPPERLEMGVPRRIVLPYLDALPQGIHPTQDGYEYLVKHWAEEVDSLQILGGEVEIDRFRVQTKITDDWVKQAWADEVEAHERSLRQASLDRDTADWSRHAYVVQVGDRLPETIWRKVGDPPWIESTGRAD